MSKKRILFVNEFSQLATGFSTYGNEIMKRLYASGEYEIAEQANYVMPEDARIDDVPWQVYPVMPSQGDHAGWQAYNSNRSAQFGSLKFTDTLLTFKPHFVWNLTDWWMCLVNSDVWLSNGEYKDISKVNVGDKVITYNGSSKVVRSKSKTHKGKLHNYKLSLSGLSFSCTPDHRILTAPKLKVRNGKFNISVDSFKWKESRDININDSVLFPLPNYKNTKSSFSDDELFAMGFWVGEGCYLKNKDCSIKTGIQIAGNKNEGLIVDRCISALSKWDAGCHIHNHDNSTPNTFGKGKYVGRISSRIIADRLYDFFGEYSHSKKLPQWVMELPPEQAAKFLQGLIVAGGTLCEKQNSGRFMTTSKALSIQVWHLLLKCNVWSTRNEGTTVLKGKRFNRYLLNVNSNQTIAWRQLYTYGKPYHTLLCDKILNDKYVISKINNKTESDYEGLVYDIEVEKEHNYCIGCIVHNCEYIIHHPLRNHFRFIHMPTIDGEPQRLDWLYDYRMCDVITTYSEWAKNLLENNRIKVSNVTQPSVDEKVFCPPDDKKKQKERLGLNPDWFIIQTVMRNQPRKLYPDLFKSFVKYLELCKQRGRQDLAAKTYLHIHTSLQDVGWDIGAEIQKYHLGHKVLLTYMDQSNGQCYISFYKGRNAWSRTSNVRSATTTNTGKGVTREQLAEIMKCADLYLTYSVCEGSGMGAHDAKSCGVPIMGLPYSAVAEQTIQPGGIPLKIASFSQEPIDQTSQRRALPDNDYTANEFYKFFSNSQSYRDELGSAARKYILEHQTWDICADKWRKIFNETEIIPDEKSWLSPYTPFQPDTKNIPWQLPNDIFVQWAITNLTNKFWIFGYNQINQFITHLNDGVVPVNGRPQPFNKQMFVQHLLNINDQCNKTEQDRYNRLCVPQSNGFTVYKA